MTDGVQKLARLSLLLALATVIHTAESLLPLTFVWFRFGFANIIGLSTLYLFGFRDALFVTLGRVFLGSLASGLFGSPAFLLSLSGSGLAILAMGVAHFAGARLFSEVGISVVGAVAHNVAQLCVAYLLLIRNEGIFLLLPVMLLTALATGILNGLAARFFIATFRRTLGEVAHEHAQ
jgi:heptaprenyl diphosphate synthase